MTKRLLLEIQQLRAQTRMAVTQILKDCSSSMEEQTHLLCGQEKKVLYVSDLLCFSSQEERFYLFFDRDMGENKRMIRLLEDGEIELMIQDISFMPRLEEIFNASQIKQ